MRKKRTHWTDPDSDTRRCVPEAAAHQKQQHRDLFSIALGKIGPLASTGMFVGITPRWHAISQIAQRTPAASAELDSMKIGLYQRETASTEAHLDNRLLASDAEELGGASMTPDSDIDLLQLPRASLTWTLGATLVAAQQL